MLHLSSGIARVFGDSGRKRCSKPSTIFAALSACFDGRMAASDFVFSEEDSDDSDFLSGSDGALLRKAVAGIHSEEAQAFWRDVLGAPPYILAWLRGGYPLTFPKGPPPPSQLPNNASAVAPHNRAFVSEALAQLLAAGAISRVEEGADRPYLVLPLQVAVQSSGKKRIIVDASRQLNRFLQDGKVKLDHLCKVAPCL